MEYKFTYELKKDLVSELKSELNIIIDEISTTDLPLVNIDVEDINTVSYFTLDQYNFPNLQIITMSLPPSFESGSLQHFTGKLNIQLQLLWKNIEVSDTYDDDLEQDKLEMYTKAIMIFINNHYNKYRLDGNGFEYDNYVLNDEIMKVATCELSIFTDIYYTH
jgi:hypothetical protein